MRVRNAAPIRRQPKRAYHVAGVPNDLYLDEEKQCGFDLDLPAWEELAEVNSVYGKFRLECYTASYSQPRTNS